MTSQPITISAPAKLAADLAAAADRLGLGTSDAGVILLRWALASKDGPAGKPPTHGVPVNIGRGVIREVSALEAFSLIDSGCARLEGPTPYWWPKGKGTSNYSDDDSRFLPL